MDHHLTVSDEVFLVALRGLEYAARARRREADTLGDAAAFEANAEADKFAAAKADLIAAATEGAEKRYE